MIDNWASQKSDDLLLRAPGIAVFQQNRLFCNQMLVIFWIWLRKCHIRYPGGLWFPPSFPRSRPVVQESNDQDFVSWIQQSQWVGIYGGTDMKLYQFDSGDGIDVRVQRYFEQRKWYQTLHIERTTWTLYILLRERFSCGNENSNLLNRWNCEVKSLLESRRRNSQGISVSDFDVVDEEMIN